MDNRTEQDGVRTEPTRNMVEPPDVEPKRDLSTGNDGEAKQPIEGDEPADADE